MVKYILLAFSFGLLISCTNEPANKEKANPILEKIAGKDYAKMIEIPTTSDGKVDSNSMARISFDNNNFYFDTIFEGDRITASFPFENTGKKDLYILETNSSCGCTVSKYSKASIAPGVLGEIKVQFDSKGKRGPQNRKISVVSNSFPSETILYLEGYVKQLK